MYKILIADDEAIIRKGLTQLLDWKELGFEITGEAANGKEALTFIEKYAPNIVMIDIRMPNLLGIDVIKAAREKGYNGRFIILTGYADFAYAQEAIRYNVSSYLTKPVDENELKDILLKIKAELDKEHTFEKSNALYQEKAHNTILAEFISGKLKPTDLILDSLSLNADSYRVVLHEKYRNNTDDASYSFSDLLKQLGKNCIFDELSIDGKNVILFKGQKSLEALDRLIEKYNDEMPPETNSPLDTFFITCGTPVKDAADIPKSYAEADTLLSKRFFCDQYQHIIEFKPQQKAKYKSVKKLSKKQLLDTYTELLMNHIQAYNRNEIAETLRSLQEDLYHSDLDIEDEKNLLVDLYLHIKEKIFYTYKASKKQFMPNSEAVNTILNSYYLYEIIAFLSNQYEIIMASIGYSSRDSIIDDIVHYINHNYQEPLTLENIAPLFGYNSSYLGKIFNQKMGIGFNAYLDKVRIEHSKELLLTNNTQIYKIAELVGYKNVDYFHIKFKKHIGMSPAEYRKQHKAAE